MTRRKDTGSPVGPKAPAAEAPAAEAPAAEAPAAEAPAAEAHVGIPLSSGCYITDIRVHALKAPVGNLVANAQIVIGGVFIVKEIRVLSGSNGYFIGFPSKKKGDGYEDVANPLTAAARATITSLILEKYQDLLNQESGL